MSKADDLLPDAEVAALYETLTLDELQHLRAALVLDAQDARQRKDAEAAVFCWGRIGLIDEEVARRAPERLSP